MDSKLLKFIILMNVISVLIWLAGEIIIVAVLGLSGIASIVWSVVMLCIIIALSMWKSFKKDNDENSRKW